MSARRGWIALAIVLPVALILGVAILFESSLSSFRDAHVLLIDPRTGKTLHERKVDGGYAVTVLLSDGRVAVATVDSCLEPQNGGSLTVLDATLEHVVSKGRLPPCTVAGMGVSDLRRRLGETLDGPAPRETASGYRVVFGRGSIVEGFDAGDSLQRSNSLSVYDATGHLLWKRSSFGGWLGAVDARDGRIVIPVFGTFRPGAD